MNFDDDPEASSVTQLRETTRRATRDLDNGRIKAGEVYVEWVGIVDGEFTIDRKPIDEFYGTVSP